MKSKKTEQLLIRISPDLRRAVDEATAEDEVTLSEWMRRAIECYLRVRREEKEGVSPDYKTMMLKCLDDDEFRAVFLQKLSDS